MPISISYQGSDHSPESVEAVQGFAATEQEEEEREEEVVEEVVEEEVQVVQVVQGFAAAKQEEEEREEEVEIVEKRRERKEDWRKRKK